MKYLKPSQLFILILTIISVWGLTACGSEDKSSSTTTGATANQKASSQVVLPTFTATPLKTLILVPTAIQTSIPVQASTQGVAIVTADDLNLRTEPNTSALIITQLAAGDCLTVKQTQADWSLLIMADGREGWSATKYLSPTAVCPTQPPDVTVAGLGDSPLQKKAVVNPSVLNIRSGPGIAFQQVNQLVMNDCVDVLGIQNDWVQVWKAPDLSGWCSKDLVTLTDTCPTLAEQNAVAPVASSPAVQLSSYAGQPFVPNAMVTKATTLYECFGAGTNELRPVTSNTPVQVLGTGPFVPPYAELGNGPFLKIRIWDGQYAWIPAETVNVELAGQPTVSGQCEAYDRINWSTVVPSRPTSVPSWEIYTGGADPGTGSAACCKICRKGKACGDTCISRSYTCHKGPGCACDG